MQLRVIKNDYDFTSASFYSVQQGGAVLGAIGFRTDGGDKHPLIDVIKGGTFSLQQMFAQFLFPNWNPAWQVLMDGKPFSGKAIDIPLNTRISMDVGACRIGIQIRAAAFVLRTSVPDAAQPSLRWSQSDGKATLELTLYKKTEAAPFHWADLQDAGAAFTCIFDDSSTSLSKFDRDFKASTFNTSATTDRLRYIWAPPVAAGAESLELTVHGATRFSHDSERLKMLRTRRLDLSPHGQPDRKMLQCGTAN